MSTDKAVYPINAMGMSKALSEKVMVAKSRDYNNNGSGTILCAVQDTEMLWHPVDQLFHYLLSR